MLGESSSRIARLTQSFTVPESAEVLCFTIEHSALVAAPFAPGDAFEVALLDAVSLTPAEGVADALDGTDALINLQSDGTLHLGSAVSVFYVSGTAAGAMQVEIDLTGLAGRMLTLYLDLLGTAGPNSTVTIDDVHFGLHGPIGPALSVQLDPAFDSGVAGDNITRLNTVDLIGTTEPGLLVVLDVDANGVDDAEATVDANGQYRFSQIGLAEGTNTLRVRATNAHGVTTRSVVVQLDTISPLGVLTAPLPDQLTNLDLGYVEVIWSDLGSSGIDNASIDPTDVTVTGVSIDRVEILPEGRVRYWYNDDRETLPEGPIDVTFVAGAVRDVAGNANLAGTASFTVDRQGPVGMLVTPPTGSTIIADLGYIDIQWTDIGAAGRDAASIDASDVIISGVSVDRVELLGGGLVRYWYSDDGDSLAAGPVLVTSPAGATTDQLANPSLEFTSAFTFAPLQNEPEDVTDRVTANFYGRQFNRFTGVYGLYASITNDSGDQLAYPIRLLLTELGPDGTAVENAHGTLEDGTPYFDFEGVSALAPGQTTAVVVIAIKSPPRTLYTFVPRVFAVVTGGGDVQMQSMQAFSLFSVAAEPTTPPATFQNPANPYDVNGDGLVSPLDSLLVLNDLRRATNPIAADMAATIDVPASHFVDVNGDGIVTPLDALLVLNHLSRRPVPAQLTETAPPALAAVLSMPAQPDPLPAVTAYGSPEYAFTSAGTEAEGERLRNQKNHEMRVDAVYASLIDDDSPPLVVDFRQAATNSSLSKSHDDTARDRSAESANNDGNVPSADAAWLSLNF